MLVEKNNNFFYRITNIVLIDTTLPDHLILLNLHKMLNYMT